VYQFLLFHVQPKNWATIKVWPFAITRVEHPWLSLFASSAPKLGQLSSLFKSVIRKLIDVIELDHQYYYRTQDCNKEKQHRHTTLPAHWH